jgi:hypothetical protein
MQLQLLEEDTFSFFSGFAQRPGGELGEEGDAIWYRSGVPSLIYSSFLGEGTAVAATAERVRAWGVPALGLDRRDWE